MPYFVPAWAVGMIGVSTEALPRKIVSPAWYQFMPSEMSDEASMYVGMHADIEIHNAAMSFKPHLRSLTVVGAISSFQYGECEMSSVTSWMPLVTRTPSSSWTGTFIRLRSQLGNILVRFGTAIAIELPDVAHVANHIEIEIGHDDRILVAGTFRNDLAARIRKITRSVKFPETPRLLRPDPVDCADIIDIGDRCGRLLQFPQILAQTRRCRARVEHDLRAIESEQPPALGKMSVVANIHADLADRCLEYRIAEIAGLEVKLLPETGFAVRDVALAIFAEKFAVGVNDRRRIVIRARGLFLVNGGNDYHAVLLCVLLHQFHRRTAGDPLCWLVPFKLLLAAEIRAVEDFLHAKPLHAL